MEELKQKIGTYIPIPHILAYYGFVVNRIKRFSLVVHTLKYLDK